MFKLNDLVVLKNDPNKIIFIINQINEKYVYLTGYIYRIFKIVDLTMIELANIEQIEKENILLSKQLARIKKLKQRITQKVIFGTILHIDSDEHFLESCMNLYKEMNVHVWGVHLKEKDVSKVMNNILDEITPDIIVITGHDYYNGKDPKNLLNYENSNKYIEAIRVIRKRFNNDAIIVVAGACCSHFEALIANGANFASSPKRIHIHTYDPAIIAIKCATTSCNQIIDFNNVLKFIENGRDAYGGIETKGKMKILL